MSDSLLQSIRELTSGGSFDFESASYFTVQLGDSYYLTIEDRHLYVMTNEYFSRYNTIGFLYDYGSQATAKLSDSQYSSSITAAIVLYVTGDYLLSVAFSRGFTGTPLVSRYKSYIQSRNLYKITRDTEYKGIKIPRRSSSNYNYMVITHFYFPPFDAQKEGRLDKMSDSLLQGIRQLSGGGIDLSKYTMTYKTGEQRVSESIDNKKGYIYSYSFSALWFTGARFSWGIYDYDSRSDLVKREDCGSTNVLIFTDGEKYHIFYSFRKYNSRGDNYSLGDSFDVTSSSILVYATSGSDNGLYSSITLAPKIENVATATWITFLKTLSLVLSNLSSFNPFFSFERKSERKEKDNMGDIYTLIMVILSFLFKFRASRIRMWK